jgi:hypothetical protein
VASQLLKYCHWQEDTLGHTMELRFLRDTDKREIDFVVLRDRRPAFGVECKAGERAVGENPIAIRRRSLGIGWSVPCSGNGAMSWL